MKTSATIDFINPGPLSFVLRSSCRALLPSIEKSLAKLDSTYVYLHSRLLLFLWKGPNSDRLIKCSLSVAKVDFNLWQVSVACHPQTDPRDRKAFYADVLAAFGELLSSCEYSALVGTPFSETLESGSLSSAYGGISLLPQLSYLIA